MAALARKFEVVTGGLQGCPIQPLKRIEQPIDQPLNNLEKWLSVAEVAALKSVSAQAVQKAFVRGRWDGVDLQIREVEIGRGGAGGLARQVHVDSLPSDLREAWYAAQGISLTARAEPRTGATILVPDAKFVRDARHDAALREARWRLSLIQPIMKHAKYSGDRKAAVAEVARGWFEHPAGGQKQPSASRLYAWITDYEARGLNGLIDAPRCDKGQKKLIISRQWDGFILPMIGEARGQEIASDLTTYIRSLWSNGIKGWRAAAEFSTSWLLSTTRGLELPDFGRLPEGVLQHVSGDLTQFGLCYVNRRIVENEASYAILDVKGRDNAVYQDSIMPTIRRDYSALLPRDIVVGDVHPMDVMVLRPDGSRAYPKAISWFDPATCEIHMTFALLEKGEGVRREHVAMSFEAMVADWGLPKLLYLDNGSEYGWAEMLNGFTQLSKLTGQLTVKEFGGSLVDARVAESRQSVVRSLAYNAKGKPGIEGTFGNLEKVFFQGIKGWTAGERMRKKTHAKGRDPEPFPGTMAEFLAQASTALEWYHKRAQFGRLEGRSPNEALRRQIDAGWGKTVLASAEVLALAFSTEDSRVVDRGSVQFAPRDGKSEYYYHDVLLNYPGQRITIRVPAYDPQYLFCFDGEELICIARPEVRFDPLDQAGAIELSRRARSLRRHITEKAKHCVLLDLMSETARHNAMLPDAPEVPVQTTIDTGLFARMAALKAEEDAKRVEEQTTPRREVSQWAVGENKHLKDFKFAEEEA